MFMMLLVRQVERRRAVELMQPVDAAVLVQDAAVSMAGVFAETNIARNVELGEKGAQLLDSKDNRAIGIVRKRSLLVLRTSQPMAPLFP